MLPGPLKRMCFHNACREDAQSFQRGPCMVIVTCVFIYVF